MQVYTQLAKTAANERADSRATRSPESEGGARQSAVRRHEGVEGRCGHHQTKAAAQEEGTVYACREKSAEQLLGGRTDLRGGGAERAALLVVAEVNFEV